DREASVAAGPHRGVARGGHAAVRHLARSRRRLDRAAPRPPRRPVSRVHHGSRHRPMTPLRATVLRGTSFLVTPLVFSCGGDRSRSPTCGMAQLIGPSLIQDQLRVLPYVLTEAPRGLPGSLPARVAGTAPLSTVTLPPARGRLALPHQRA